MIVKIEKETDNGHFYIKINNILSIKGRTRMLSWFVCANHPVVPVFKSKEHHLRFFHIQSNVTQYLLF